MARPTLYPHVPKSQSVAKLLQEAYRKHCTLKSEGYYDSAGELVIYTELQKAGQREGERIAGQEAAIAFAKLPKHTQNALIQSIIDEDPVDRIIYLSQILPVSHKKWPLWVKIRWEWQK